MTELGVRQIFFIWVPNGEVEAAANMFSILYTSYHSTPLKYFNTEFKILITKNCKLCEDSSNQCKRLLSAI